MITPASAVVESQSVWKYRTVSILLAYDVNENPVDIIVTYVALDASGNPLPAPGGVGTNRTMPIPATPAAVITWMTNTRTQADNYLASQLGLTGATVA